MSVNPFAKKYRPITDELVLFNDEYYLSVWKLPLDGLDQDEIASLFDTLYAFEHPDIEMEIDVSEEAKGQWHVQLLVPYMLTLADAAIRRMRRGAEALCDYLSERGVIVTAQALKGEEILAYVKRYNPDVHVEQNA